jgi:hypothetical protein
VKRTTRHVKRIDWAELIRWWVWGHWICVRTGKPSHKLLPFHDFDVFVRARLGAISEKQCARIGAAAQRAGVIEGDEIREENEDEARRRIGEAMK